MNLSVTRWEGYPHLLRTQQFTRESLFSLCNLTNRIETGWKSGERFHLTAAGKVLLALFYQPSTRTWGSFARAALNLGMQCLDVRDPERMSSEFKGESLEDAARTYGGPRDPGAFRITDGIVMRHKTEGLPERFAAASNVPVINGGDGKNQHPTQSILDTYAIMKAFGRLDNLHVGFVGDLTGRTPRSLAYLLSKCGHNLRFSFFAPRELQMPNDVCVYAAEHEVPLTHCTAFDGVLETVDVLYVTRLQTESGSATAQRPTFQLRPRHLKQLQDHARVFHPLPIDASCGAENSEIAPELWERARAGEDPRLAWFTGQCDFNIPLRMAILASIFGNERSFT